MAIIIEHFLIGSIQSQETRRKTMVLIRNQKLFRSVRNNLHEDHNFDLEMYRVLLAGQIESCRFNIWCNTCKKHLDYQELKTILRDSFTEWKQTY